MLRDLDYQIKVLRVFDDYLDKLVTEKLRADQITKLATENPELALDIPDFTARTWQLLQSANSLPLSRSKIPYSPRTDGLGRPVPNVAFKIPTGGGKTYLAVSAISRIFGRYLGRNTGFVLWIVPNEAIYSQTKRNLTDRDHPYRQMLDRTSAGRVRIMEKSSPLNAQDIAGNLCVMLLMLQSANRQTKETLKMFQDRGDVHGFFPPEGDHVAHEIILEQIPNLDSYSAGTDVGPSWFSVKDSLGNVLRLIRPVVIVDEGHRAISRLAHSTLYGFNPAFVLELSATPKDVASQTNQPPRYANVLVEVTGLELDREGMIKMPLNLEPHQGTDWRATLAAALDRLYMLTRLAQTHQAEGGNYIRPILLVQVERTGADQRTGELVHALDVKQWLLAAGFDEAEVAIKTAETNDLNSPELQDLLSPTNRIRVIVTKQALQEGWDCPFAYILCSLAASSNLTAMTQLVGRILRQPYATRTGMASLDECYVVTHHADTARVIQAVKQGLEQDGLGDLVTELSTTGLDATELGPRKVERRRVFTKTDIYLPLVLRIDDAGARILDYETDILCNIDWHNIDTASFVRRIPTTAYIADSQMRRIRLSEGDKKIVDDKTERIAETLHFDPVYAVRLILDIVPNPWVAREIVANVTKGLIQRGFTQDSLGQVAGLITEQMRRWLDTERSRLAEAYFRNEVAAGRIQFRLRTDGNNWVLPKESQTYVPAMARQLVRKNGEPLQRSLFSPIYEADFSSDDERDIAVYLDADKAIHWWHRNVARIQYGIQGWKREKIYPDFVFAVPRTGDSVRIFVVETKGDHLGGNLDTEYKRALLSLLSDAFLWETTIPAGSMELIHPNGDTVNCALVLMSDWKLNLPSYLDPGKD